MLLRLAVGGRKRTDRRRHSARGRPYALAFVSVAVACSGLSMRSRTLYEKQPYLLGYSAAISVFSPCATAWQLCKIYNKSVPLPRLAGLAAQIFPHQTALKLMQMNAATPVKEYCNPWAAFFVVGVLQGGVYGQSNVHFANKLQLSTKASLKGMFRGSAFAGCRDSLSQGIPFALSRTVEATVFDPVWRSVFAAEEDDSSVSGAKRAASVMFTSIAATFMSQGLHNGQIKMQAEQSLSYVGVVQTLYAEHVTTQAIPILT